MSAKQIRRAAPALAFLFAGFALVQAQQDPGTKPTTGQKIGEKLDEAYQEARGGLKKAGESIKDQYGKSKTAVHNMGVEGRIYGRLHWDKALKNATIELTVTGSSVVTLEGTVASQKAKLRAVDLTQETEGVEQVIDHLAIRPEGTRTSPAPEKP